MSNISLASNVYLGGNASQVFSGNNRIWRKYTVVKDFWPGDFDSSSYSWISYIDLDGICRIGSSSFNTYGQATVPAAYQGAGAVRKCISTIDVGCVIGPNNVCQFFGRNDVANYGAIRRFPASLVNSPTIKDIALNHPYHAAALRTNNSVIAWGRLKTEQWLADTDAINNDPRLTSDVVKIQWCGQGGTFVALKSNGSVVIIPGNPASDPWAGNAFLTANLTGIRDIIGGRWGATFATIDNQDILTIYRADSIDPRGIITQCPTEFLSTGSTLHSLDMGFGAAIALRKDGSVVTWGNQSRVLERGVAIDPQPEELLYPRPGGATGMKIALFAHSHPFPSGRAVFYVGLPDGLGNYRMVYWNFDIRVSNITPILLSPDYTAKFTPYDINTGYWVRNDVGVSRDAPMNVSAVTDVKFSTYAKRFVCTTVGRGPRGTGLSTINGWYNYLDYDNSNQFLTTQFNGVESNIQLRESGSSFVAESLVFLAKKRAVDTINSVWIQDSGGSGRAIFNTPDNTLFVDCGTKTSDNSAHRITISNIWPTRDNTTAHIFIITLTPNPAQGQPSIAVWRDGTLIGSLNLTAPVTATVGNTTILGNNAGFANSFLAELAEFISFGYILSSTDRQKIEGYLAWKYATDSQLPEDHPYKLGAPLRI